MLAVSKPPAMVRWITPLAWRGPEKISEKLLGFAATELGSARDMMLAAESTSDPQLRRLFLRHALDEYNHAKMFEQAARRVAPGLRVRPYEAHHAEPQHLFEKWGEVRFVAFIHISESRAAAQFQALASHFADDDLGRLFESIGRDEKFHCRYSEHLLQSWREQGREAEVEAAVSRVKRSLLWMAWRRAGRRIGDLLVMGIMLSLFVGVLPLFALISRLFDRSERAGWKAADPRDNNADLEHARSPS